MMLNSPSLLITDDDQAFRETLQEVLRPQGFRTVLAGDGEEALAIIQAEDVHVALLDMHMPKLTGLETLRRLKQFKSILPCILLSARLDEAIVQQAQKAQAFSVLAKPVTRRLLTATIRRALRHVYDCDWPE
jgi:CheY-like chemotaxis protein